jgi:hypothetical protein
VVFNQANGLRKILNIMAKAKKAAAPKAAAGKKNNCNKMPNPAMVAACQKRAKGGMM